MQRRISMYVASVVALAAVLWWPVWMLDTGPMAHFFNTGFQVFYGSLTIVLLCIVTAGALVIGILDLTKDAPEGHKHFYFKLLMHH
ncbi:MAG TPA: hypothetical protein VG844_19160 [Terracidiphilus sp.]|nr:hypothetical protein [Terracidiphilus sp.]